jgi:hypothetical protein
MRFTVNPFIDLGLEDLRTDHEPEIEPSSSLEGHTRRLSNGPKVAKFLDR